MAVSTALRGLELRNPKHSEPKGPSGSKSTAGRSVEPWVKPFLLQPASVLGLGVAHGVATIEALEPLGPVGLMRHKKLRTIIY